MRSPVMRKRMPSSRINLEYLAVMKARADFSSMESAVPNPHALRFQSWTDSFSIAGCPVLVAVLVTGGIQP
jgi:hypothetical protein